MAESSKETDDDMVDIIFLGTGSSTGVPSMQCILSADGPCKTCRDGLEDTAHPNYRLNPSIMVRKRFGFHSSFSFPDLFSNVRARKERRGSCFSSCRWKDGSKSHVQIDCTKQVGALRCILPRPVKDSSFQAVRSFARLFYDGGRFTTSPRWMRSY